MNLCVFAGNLTRDPEVRNVGSEGTAVASFGIATNRKFKSKNGDMKDDTTFVECEAWSTAAETIGKYCKKGNYIIVYCTAKNDNWEDTDGKKRSRVKFRVDRFEFVPGTRKQNNDFTPDEAPAPVDETQLAGVGSDVPF